MAVNPIELPSDEEFLDLARNAPDKAVEVVTIAMGGQLVGYLTKRLGNRQEAEDCLQETTIRVMSDLPTYDKSVPVANWIYLRANWTMQKMRQRVARSLVQDGETDEAPAVTRFDPDSMARLEELAGAFLATLTKPKRDLMEKRLVLGWTHEEIAAECGLNPDAVRKAYSRVLAAFKRALEEQGLWP